MDFRLAADILPSSLGRYFPICEGSSRHISLLDLIHRKSLPGEMIYFYESFNCEPTMKSKPGYRVHSLDNKGHVVSKKYLKAGEQVDAVREAMSLAVNCSLEVWKGPTLIVHIDPRRGPTLPLSRSRSRSVRRAARSTAQHS
jgi:hypothetical protein